MTLLERLREVGCNRQPFTPEHADCICRLTNEAADEIERLRDVLRKVDHTVSVHGKMDCDTDLHKLVQEAID